MGAHIDKDGEFQSDKYPTCPAGKVPLSVKDPTAQPLLWEYAQIRRVVDAEFSSDLEASLTKKGFAPRVRAFPELDNAQLIQAVATVWYENVEFGIRHDEYLALVAEALARMGTR